MLRLVTSVANVNSLNIKMPHVIHPNIDAAQGRQVAYGQSLVFPHLKKTDSGGKGQRNSPCCGTEPGMSLVPRVEHCDRWVVSAACLLDCNPGTWEREYTKIRSDEMRGCERLTEKKREKRADRQKGNFPLWMHTTVSLHCAHVFIHVCSVPVWTAFILHKAIKEHKMIKRTNQQINFNWSRSGHRLKIIDVLYPTIYVCWWLV